MKIFFIALIVVYVEIVTAKYAFRSAIGDWDKRSMGESHIALCHEERKSVELEDGVHFFRPSIYTEVTCKNAGKESSDLEICTELAFRCVQLYSTVYIMKTTTEGALNDCWHYEEKKIPYGCSCVRPPEIEDRF